MIPISSVRFGIEEEREVLDTLRSGHIAQGEKVARLERRFAEVFDLDHVVAVSNGTIALVAALEVLDLRPGDVVLTTPFTFVATVNAILESGATARFADIGEDFNLDPMSVEERIDDRTRVILPVHLYGQTADMGPIARLAARAGAQVVEDAAQAHGATWQGRPAGSFGDLGTFSLYATKNITSGEGGLISTGDERLADRLRVLRNQGMRARYHYEIAGHNYRMTDLQAAVALPQLERYGTTVAERRDHAARLTEGLEGIPGLILPRAETGRGHVWHQYTVRVTAEAPLDRDGLGAALEQRGVGSGIYYPRLLGDYAAYRDHPRVRIDPTPRASRIASEVLSLPVHNGLSPTDVDIVIDAVRSAFGAS